MRVVEFNSNNWKLSKCSCVLYLKNYICSHIIVLEYNFYFTSLSESQILWQESYLGGQ